MSNFGPCPYCSEYRRGVWTPIRPTLYPGQSSKRWTLSCGAACPVLGEAPWIAEFNRPPRFSENWEDQSSDLKRLRTPERCQAILARWWRRRAARWDVSAWDADKLRKWREIE